MTRKALIVEDERDLGQLLGEHVRRWGFEPTLFHEGKGVVNWVRLNQPAVILLDLMLPDTDGYTICETLKLERETNLIPVVMVTALSGQEEKVKGLQVGANRYITKPFAADDLRRAIQDAIAELRARMPAGSPAGTVRNLLSGLRHSERAFAELRRLRLNLRLRICSLRADFANAAVRRDLDFTVAVTAGDGITKTLQRLVHLSITSSLRKCCGRRPRRSGCKCRRSRPRHAADVSRRASSAAACRGASRAACRPAARRRADP